MNSAYINLSLLTGVEIRSMEDIKVIKVLKEAIENKVEETRLKLEEEAWKKQRKTSKN